MDPVTVSITIDRPREEVFDFLADIANHPSFSDHYLTQWRLTRTDSWGQGAGARFRFKRRNRFAWGDTTFVRVDPPYRIVGAGRSGKFNRVKTLNVWTLAPNGAGTRLELSTETEPAMLSDRLLEAFGYRGWCKRQSAKALRRLRRILEDGETAPARATVAGV